MLFFVLLCTCVSALANNGTTDDPLVTRTEVEAFQLGLQLINLQGVRTVVTLKQLDGSAHYQTRVKEHKGYAVSLPLAEAPEGRYLLTVKQGKTLRQQVVVKSAAGVMISDWK